MQGLSVRALLVCALLVAPSAFAAPEVPRDDTAQAPREAPPAQEVAGEPGEAGAGEAAPEDEGSAGRDDATPAGASSAGAPEGEAGQAAGDGAAPREAGALGVMTVTATRSERIDLDVPSSVSVLDVPARLERRPAQDLAKALHGVPGVHTQETGPAQGSPFVRGLTGYHVLTLVDGVRLNGSYFRAGPNQYLTTIDPLIVEGAEVVRGPGSILYGSDALGGVIALRTRTPARPDGVGPDEAWFRSALSLRYHQPLRQGGEPILQPRVEATGGRGPFAALIGFSGLEAGDREGGRHQKTLRNSAYSVVSGDAKLVYRPTPRDVLTLAYQRTEVLGAPRTHSTVASESYRGTAPGTDLRRDLDQTRQLIALQGETRGRGPFARAKASLSLHSHAEEEVRVRGDGGRTTSGFEVHSLGASVEAESDLPGPLELALVYGLDYSHDFVSSFETDRGLRRPRGPIADDAHYDLFGAYTQLELRLDPVILHAGVRYALARVVARDVDPDPSDAFPIGRLVATYDAVVASAGMTYRVLPGLSLVGSVGQGFRAPNLDDTTAFRPVSSNAFDSPSPRLEPETSLTLEVGAKWAFEAFRGQVFYAYTFLEDMIARVPTGRTVDERVEFINRNAAEGSIQAIDGELALLLDPLAERLGFELPLGGLALLARGSWVRGYGQELVDGRFQRDHLRRAPPASLAGVLRWEEPETGWVWAELEAELTRRQRRLSADDRADTQRIPPGGTPGYTLWSIRAGVKLYEERLRASLGLENVFDRDHRPHGSGTNGPGRRLTVAVEVSW